MKCNYKNELLNECFAMLDVGYSYGIYAFLSILGLSLSCVIYCVKTDIETLLMFAGCLFFLSVAMILLYYIPVIYRKKALEAYGEDCCLYIEKVQNKNLKKRLDYLESHGECLID